jgi:hypothetical protein
MQRMVYGLQHTARGQYLRGFRPVGRGVGVTFFVAIRGGEAACDTAINRRKTITNKGIRYLAWRLLMS